MTDKVKTLRIDDKNVIVTTADIDESKEYTINIEVKEIASGPTGADDICIIRIEK